MGMRENYANENRRLGRGGVVTEMTTSATRKERKKSLMV